MTLQQPCMAQGDSSSSSGKVSTISPSKETTNTNAFDRKRQQLLENSMAVVDRELYRCLDIALSGPMQRVGKRARAAVDSDHDSGVEEDWGVTSSGSGTSTTAAKEKTKSAKKRAKREPASSSAKTQVLTPAPSSTADGDDGAAAVLFACPFYANNPGKYKTAKTCCGPGWPTSHRVKEHIYRRHCLKNTCFRCYESFKSDEELKNHQRLDEPCKKSNRTVDNDNVITEKQEKALHTRAKQNQAEDERWTEMYKIIFPGAKKIPSPYHQPAPAPPPQATSVKPEHEKPRTVNNAPAYTTSPSTSTSRSVTPATASSPAGNRGAGQRSGSDLDSIQFDDVSELIEFRHQIHRNLSRAVRPVLERELDKMLRSVQTAMTQKVPDFCKEVVTRAFRTWQFGSEQSKTRLSRSRSSSRSQSYQAEEVLAPQGHAYAQTCAPRAGGGSYPQPSNNTSHGDYGHSHHEQAQIEESAAAVDPGPFHLDFEQIVAEAPLLLGDLMTEDGQFNFETFLGGEDCAGVEEFSLAGTTGPSDSAYFSTTSGVGTESLGSLGGMSSSGW